MGPADARLPGEAAPRGCLESNGCCQMAASLKGALGCLTPPRLPIGLLDAPWGTPYAHRAAAGPEHPLRGGSIRVSSRFSGCLLMHSAVAFSQSAGPRQRAPIAAGCGGRLNGLAGGVRVAPRGAKWPARPSDGRGHLALSAGLRSPSRQWYDGSVVLSVFPLAVQFPDGEQSILSRQHFRLVKTFTALVL